MLVMATEFIITSGSTTNDGNAFIRNDAVSVAGVLVETGVEEGIDTIVKELFRFGV